MYKVLEDIGKIGIVPVIALNNAKDALPLGKALCEGGLPCAEITFRTEAAEESIRILTNELPQILVGAGTILTIDQVDRAVAAGAKFIVSPGLNPKIVRYCMEKDIPILPGCANPSDVEQAIELGLTAVKFFPAEAAGGINMIKAMAAPYVNMKFMPTGGISTKNLTTYLDFKKIIACGGSWMVKQELVDSGDFESITVLTKEAVRSMLDFELRHVGINATDEASAMSMADTIEAMFGFEKRNGNSSIFNGTGFEIMKNPYLGMHGHLAIGTNYIERAVYHLEMMGYELDKETAKFNEKGELMAIYFKQELGGFAFHLVQK